MWVVSACLGVKWLAGVLFGCICSSHSKEKKICLKCVLAVCLWSPLRGLGSSIVNNVVQILSFQYSKKQKLKSMNAPGSGDVYVRSVPFLILSYPFVPMFFCCATNAKTPKSKSEKGNPVQKQNLYSWDRLSCRCGTGGTEGKRLSAYTRKRQSLSFIRLCSQVVKSSLRRL